MRLQYSNEIIFRVFFLAYFFQLMNNEKIITKIIQYEKV